MFDNYRARRRHHRHIAQRRREMADDLQHARSLIVRALGISTKPWVLEHCLVAIDSIDAALADLAPNDRRPDVVSVPEGVQ